MNKIVVWDPSHLKEIEEAKRVYREYKALRYIMLKPDGSLLDFFHPSHGQFTIIAKINKTENVMKILDDSGDTRVKWTKENGKQALNAKNKFLKLIEDGYTAFSVNSSGKKKNKITEFDVDAQEIIMVPPTARG